MNKKDNDHIAHILNVTPMSTGGDISVVVYEEQQHMQQEADIALARQKLLNAIDVTEELIEDLADIAKQTQHPRAFEVASTLINTMRETSKDLLELHAKKRNLRQEVDPTNNPKNVQNNLFVGSTSELLKMIKNRGLEE